MASSAKPGDASLPAKRNLADGSTAIKAGALTPAKGEPDTLVGTPLAESSEKAEMVLDVKFEA